MHAAWRAALSVVGCLFAANSTVWIRRINAQALLEPNPADAANDRMPEGERGRLRSREADHSQKGANATKSKSYEGARIKETGL